MMGAEHARLGGALRLALTSRSPSPSQVRRGEAASTTRSRSRRRPCTGDALPRPVHLPHKDSRQEDALKLCTKHRGHDSGSMASKLLYAEALLLNERFERAMAEYRKVTLTLT